jgi:hypothetical protein
MAQPIRSIDIYLPLDYNDGRPIEESKYLRLQEELLTRLGGLLDPAPVPAPGTGANRPG